MQKHRAAAPGNARCGIMVDLDNKIIEMVVACQPVAAVIAAEPHRLVVVSVGRVLAPGVIWANRAHSQKSPRPTMTVGAPPQPPRIERAPRGAAVALALVGLDAVTPQRDRHGPALRRQPAPAGVSGGGVDGDARQRPITRTCLTSDCNTGPSHQIRRIPDLPPRLQLLYFTPT